MTEKSVTLYGVVLCVALAQECLFTAAKAFQIDGLIGVVGHCICGGGGSSAVTLMRGAPGDEWLGICIMGLGGV